MDDVTAWWKRQNNTIILTSLDDLVYDDWFEANCFKHASVYVNSESLIKYSVYIRAISNSRI